eukprot:TRINITY_DN12619_c0_g1_i1.p1 TRINITY_DN12619_c0_g1~~TRINITY_DN12619_c0_g1_i1.p1  ORF type:complete len:118 (+),score=15.87 TRINITY_DN12619_c0_g1_i1:107-460(+)
MASAHPSAPYATDSDKPTYKERNVKQAAAPWDKDQQKKAIWRAGAPPTQGRAGSPRNTGAPYATVQDAKSSPTPKVVTAPISSKAPWDRDDSNYKFKGKPVGGQGKPNAPYATTDNS